MIYFYIINKETLMPELENVMANYMNCTQMLFGKRVKYCVTYTTNQRSFDIHRRKYMHNFKVPVSNENMEGSKGLEIVSMNLFLASKIDKVLIFDSETFQQMGELQI